MDALVLVMCTTVRCKIFFDAILYKLIQTVCDLAQIDLHIGCKFFWSCGAFGGGNFQPDVQIGLERVGLVGLGLGL